MRIDWDVPIAMDDGLVLRADVFRPQAAGRYPRLPGRLSERPAADDRRASRRAGILGGTTTLYLHDSYVLIPVIP